MQAETSLQSPQAGLKVQEPEVDSYHCRLIDEDIEFRIRSLLISRNQRCPPRTPFSSDEHLNSFSNSHNLDLDIEALAPVSDTDGVPNTNKDSINRKPSQTTNIHPKRIPRHLGDQHFTRPEVKSFPPIFQQAFSEHGEEIPDKELIGNSSNVSSFQSPNKISLKINKFEDNIRSSSKSAKTVDNDSEKALKESNSPNLLDSQSFKLIIDRPKLTTVGLKPTSGDLSCSVEGLPLDHTNCGTQNSYSYQRDSLEDNNNQKFEGISKVSSSEVAQDSSNSPNKLIIPEELFKSRGLYLKKNPLKDLQSQSNILISNPMGSGSSDAFPHVIQSLEMASKESRERPYSTTVATNFSLPGVKSEHKNLKQLNLENYEPLQSELINSNQNNIYKEYNRREKSDFYFPRRPKSPSLVSAASRKSVRHYLLKPSVTDNRPLDTALAVPPVLSPMVNLASNQTGPTWVSYTEAQKLLQPKLEKSKMMLSSADTPKSQALVESSLQPSEIDENLPALGSTPSLPEKNSKLDAPAASSSWPSDNLLDVDHLRLNPTIQYSTRKIAPNDSAVGEKTIPSPGLERFEDTGSHRKPVINSLPQITESTSNQLNRGSRWNGTAQTGESCLNIISGNDPLKSKTAWWKEDTCQQINLENQAPLSPQPDCFILKDQENEFLKENYQENRIDKDILEQKKKPDILKVPINPETKKFSLEFERKATEKFDEKFPDEVKQSQLKTNWVGTGLNGAAEKLTLEPTEIFINPNLANLNDSKIAKLKTKCSQERLATGNDVEPCSTSLSESFRTVDSMGKSQVGILSPSLESESEERSYKNTIHWLKNIISSNTPVESRLTSLPPRTKERQILRIPDESKTASFKVVDDLLPDKDLKPLGPEFKKEEGETLKPGSDQGIDISVTFANTINDLEILIGKALSLAQQAGSYNDLSQIPSTLSNAAKVLKTDQVRNTPWTNQISDNGSVHQSSQNHSEENHFGISEKIEPRSVVKGTNSQKNTIDTSDNNVSEISENEFKRSPIDRVPTPYPSKARNFSEGGSDKGSDTNMPVNDKKFQGQKIKKSLVSLSRSVSYSGLTQKPTQYNIKEQGGVIPDLPRANPQHSISQAQYFPRYDQIDKLNKDIKEKNYKNEELNSHDQVARYSQNDSSNTSCEVIDFNAGFGFKYHGRGGASSSRPQGDIQLQEINNRGLPLITKSNNNRDFSLSGKTHISLQEHHLKGFSLEKSHKRQTIARDWPPGRKRLLATVACISTALIGILVGIYAGETPAIQYYIADFHHYTVLGNVFFFLGLAIPTFFAWPLPLLHGRKPYILGSMSLAMPLLFPQALAVGDFRSPYESTWRVGLLLSRTAMGFCLGFANMNFKCMLTDLFGASLQSTNPHQEHVDEFDVRRHGGGMGVWLGLWTWSALGSIGLGFLIGASIIDTLPPSWGFYVSIIIIAFVMLLNVVCPEVRRSAYRRSVAEVIKKDAVTRRLARGEVKMHLVKSGPKWWGEELHYGIKLSHKMIRQPGFLIMSLYVAWIYGQQVLIIVLLGALMSKDYNFKSPSVGMSVMAIPIGALVAIPFQKASLFSRSRRSPPLNDDGTLSKKKIHWSSHMLRRAIFVLFLPIFGLFVTSVASGPPIPFIFPLLGAGIIGFLSNLAMAECHGIIMETFDTSDLQPGMTGRPRGPSGKRTASKRTNYSSFPRVCSAFAITETFGYIFAAGASGIGGVLTRRLGRQAAIGVMAGVLLILSLLLLGILIRFTEVQIIPDSKMEEMNHYQNRRASHSRLAANATDEDEPWRPVIIGNPHQSTRRMCILELGALSRYSEIRIKNKLIDEMSLEAKHPNRNAFNSLERRIKEKEVEIFNNIRRSLSRSSRGSRRGESPGATFVSGRREMMSIESDDGARQKRR